MTTPTALDQLETKATEYARSHPGESTVTITFDPDHYARWAITAPFLDGEVMGATLEQAAQRAVEQSR